MFKKLFKYFDKKEKTPSPKQETKIYQPTKDVEIEITSFENITKVDIKEDCNVIEYVETMQKRGQEWIKDKIPNSTLFDKDTNIKRKVIYLFEQENKKYSYYTNNTIIHINERILQDNNHIAEQRLIIYKNDDNYVVYSLKHDDTRSTYFVKSHEKKNPDYEFFQLGKDNAKEIAKEVLNNLENIPNISKIIDLDLIYERFGFLQNIKPIKKINPIINEFESVKVMIKK